MIAALSGLTLAGLGKSLLKSLLNPRTWVYLVILAAVLYTGQKTYRWIYERGVQSQQPLIARLTLQRDQAIQTKEKYVRAWQTFVRETEEANRQMAAQNAATVKVLETRLQRMEASSQSKRDLTHAIPQYVPPRADAQCVVPVGFVSLFNQSIEGRASGEGSTGSALPDGAAADATAPSGIALSQVADALLYNHDEAVRRGVIIQQWQQWYRESQAQFTAAQRAKAEAIPQEIIHDSPRSAVP